MSYYPSLTRRLERESVQWGENTSQFSSLSLIFNFNKLIFTTGCLAVVPEPELDWGPHFKQFQTINHELTGPSLALHPQVLIVWRLMTKLYYKQEN